MDVLEFNMTPEEAVNRPKFHHQWMPDEIYVEKSFPIEVREALQKMGYTITQRSSIGRTELIRITGGKIEAVGDGRGDDAAEGF
jgi:gamma-glutamyltranspeptidase/glutathione hydrolase